MHKFNALLIPDSIHWITGTIALRIAAYSPWIEATVISQEIVADLLDREPALFDHYDLLHFVGPEYSEKFLPGLANKKPTVTTIHHVLDWDHVKHNIEGSAIMAVADRYRDEIIERGVPADKVVTVQNVVDLDTFHPPSEAEQAAGRTSLGLRADDFVVGFVGKATSDAGGRKGVDVFLAAAEQATAALPHLHVLLIGPGWGDLLTKVRNAGVRATWAPFLPEASDVMRAYAAMSCYAVTARVEGGPVPLLEAMAAQLPAVTTEVGIVPDVVDHGRNGLIVEQENPAAVAEALAKLAGDAPLRVRLGTAARETIAEQFSGEREMAKVPLLYQTAWKNCPARDGAAEPGPAAESWQAMTESPEQLLRRYARRPPLGEPVRRHRRWIRGREELGWCRQLRKLSGDRAAWRHFARCVVSEPDLATLSEACKSLLTRHLCDEQNKR